MSSFRNMVIVVLLIGAIPFQATAQQKREPLITLGQGGLVLRVEQKFPQIEKEFSIPEIEETIRRILIGVSAGLTNSVTSSAATLSISLKGTALGARYSDGKIHYTGARIEATLSFEAATGEVTVVQSKGQVEPWIETRSIFLDPPSEAPFGLAWPTALLDGLSQLFGHEVVICCARDESIITIVREIAVRSLDDPTLLAEITATSNESSVRREAVRRVKNQTVLAVIATSDKEWTVRRDAIERLQDRAILAEIAKSDTIPEVRKLAERRLQELQGED